MKGPELAFTVGMLFMVRTFFAGLEITVTCQSIAAQIHFFGMNLISAKDFQKMKDKTLVYIDNSYFLQIPEGIPLQNW